MRSRILTVLLSATAVTAITTAITMVAVPVGAASTRPATKVGIGCHHAATPGVATQTLAVDGAEREYLLSVPASYDPTRPAPLILDFHGLGSDQDQQALYSGLNPKAGAAGYIVITPAGTGAIRHWSWPPLLGGVADVDFVKQMLATTSRTLCIDAKRVYATGISDGAIFSTKLACALPGRLAAIAPVAGVNGTKVCGAGTPRTSVLAFHGTADPIVPYEGGRYFAGAKAADVPEPAGGRARSASSSAGCAHNRSTPRWRTGPRSTAAASHRPRRGWRPMSSTSPTPTARRTGRSSSTALSAAVTPGRAPSP